jgi:hypothetical protein
LRRRLPAEGGVIRRPPDCATKVQSGTSIAVIGQIAVARERKTFAGSATPGKGGFPGEIGRISVTGGPPPGPDIYVGAMNTARNFCLTRDKCVDWVPEPGEQGGTSIANSLIP